MIVVTGSCRVGSSLVMQTLRLLGVPVTGYAYHNDFPDVDLNPRGYWDLPLAETIDGIPDDRYRGTAVKLLGPQLAQTKCDLISKVIVCRRNPVDAIASTVKLLERQGCRYNVAATHENAEKIYWYAYALVDTYLAHSVLPCVNVQYEEMLTNSTNVIQRIANFVEAETLVSDAVANVGR